MWQDDVITIHPDIHSGNCNGWVNWQTWSVYVAIKTNQHLSRLYTNFVGEAVKICPNMAEVIDTVVVDLKNGLESNDFYSPIIRKHLELGELNPRHMRTIAYHDIALRLIADWQEGS